jgi:capsular exopolysaccharide synthesis family protein
MAPEEAQQGPPAEHDLGAYLKAIRRRMPLILLLTGLVTAAAVGFSLAQTKKYEATARIVLSQTDPINAVIDPTTPINYDPESDRNTRVSLIKLEAVAEAVKREESLDYSTTELLDKVTTEVEANSDIVLIKALDPDPETAANIATGFAEQYQEYRQETARESLNEAAVVTREQLEQLSPEEQATEQGRDLRASLREIEILAAAQRGGVEVAETADVPTDPAEPKPLMNGVLAFVLGFGFSVALAVAMEFIDRRLKDEEDVENAFGLPILATIPRPARRSQTIVPGEDRGQFEGYSALATNLRFFELGPELESIMITSPGPSEGKTSVTLGTARALAALDLRVIAIEADLRRPSFAKYGIGRGAGLSTVLAGVSDVDSSLIEVDASSLSRVDGGTGGGRARTFHVLPAGPVPPNPQALLARPMMTHVIEDARAMADVVLVDVPPLGTVNDPITLANLVDGVVLVAHLGRTTRDASRRTLRLLANVDARQLGIVVTGAAPGEGYYGAYTSPSATEVPPVAADRT